MIRSYVSLGEYDLAIAAMREMRVRNGTLKPINDDERRQKWEGPRLPSQLDCVKGEVETDVDQT